jgi:kynureninase
MNSLTVNLHLMLASFYQPRGRRRRIAIEAHAFSSDRHAVDSQIRLRGLDPAECVLELQPRPGEWNLRPEDLEETLRREADTLAVLLLPGVQYLSGELLDMERLTRIGREIGSVVGFDLAHAVGNVPLALHDWGVDFAVWCSYKYLNGGPGAPGGCFVHERHGTGDDRPRLAGWWGHDPATRFRMEPGFRPQPGVAAWQISNPPILSMAALKASLGIFQEVGMAALRAKSERLTGYFEWLLRGLEVNAEILTPAEPARRGSQLSLRVTGRSAALAQRLAAEGFICDSREPDILRIAPVALYNRFEEVHAFAHALASICGTARHP